MKRLIALTATAALLLLTSCTSSDADVASSNLSKAAEQFEIERRIVFFNGITDKYLLTIEGRCSVETTNSAVGGSLEVTCKVSPTGSQYRSGASIRPTSRGSLWGERENRRRPGSAAAQKPAAAAPAAAARSVRPISRHGRASVSA